MLRGVMHPNAMPVEIFFEQPDWVYRQGDGLSQSEAKEVLKSPAHWMARYGPGAEKQPTTPAMLLGTATHARLLEPETFDQQFAAKSDTQDHTIAELKQLLDDAGTEYKKTAKKADLESLAFPDGKPEDKRTKLSDNDYAKALGMAEAILGHPVAGPWFNPDLKDFRKYNEVGIRLQHVNGLLLKGRLDRVHRDGNHVTILDLKTTADVSPRGFARQLVDRGYDLQVAWYTHLAEQAWPDSIVEFVFVCVENSGKPHGVQVYKATPSVVHSGRLKMHHALDLYAQCQATEYWPGYEPRIIDLEMPTWADFEVAEAVI